jgi:hypothetical protein
LKQLLWAALAAVLPLTPAAARPVVAIIDGGVAKTPELQPLLVAEYDMAAARPRASFHPASDHGTMVATIFARASKGAADIVSLRIDDPAGCPVGMPAPCQGAAAPVAAAIRKAVSLGVDAINISLALKDDPAIVAAIRDAAQHGIAVVMAAGNHGRDRPDNLAMARAGFPTSVLVGALQADGSHWAETNRPLAGAIKGYNYVWRLGVNVPGRTAAGVPATGTGTSFAVPIETARLVMKLAPAEAVAKPPAPAAPVATAAEQKPTAS